MSAPALPRALRRLALAAVLALAAGPGAAQHSELSADGLMALAAQTMADGNPQGAAVLADALIARDAEDVPALILRSEAAIAMGDFDSGLEAARRAWTAAEVAPARYASARLAALSLSQQEAWTRSQFWLRRARQHAPDMVTRDSVADDYGYLRAQNPLSFQLDLSIAPSDNINNGTTNETLTLPGLPFVFALSPESRPLSGTEVTLGGGLRYRLREAPQSLTYAEVQGFGRTYRLSAESRAAVPGARGSDYAEAQLSFGLGHIWMPEGGRDPWRFAVARGRFWYAGDPYLDFSRVSVDRGVTLPHQMQLDFGATFESLEPVRRGDSEALALRAGWAKTFGEVGTVSVQLKTREVAAEGFDQAFEARGAEIGWRFAQGTALSLDVEERDYDLSLYRFDTRTDIRRTLRLSVPVPGIELYGFRPVLNAEHATVDSNVSRFETEASGVGISFRSAF